MKQLPRQITNSTMNSMEMKQREYKSTENTRNQHLEELNTVYADSLLRITA